MSEPVLPTTPETPAAATPPVLSGKELADQAAKPTIPSERQEPPHPLDDPKPRSSRRKASAADFPVIRDINGLLKDLTPKDEADAPRVAELKTKLRKALEIDAPAPAEPKAKTEEPAVSAPSVPTAPASVSAFTDAEPKLEEFVGKSDDPYAAWQRALARYDRRKDEHERQQAWVTQQQQQAQHAAQQHWQQVETAFVARVQQLAKDKPADFQKLATSPKLQNLPPIMDAAIKLSPTSEADLLHWLDDPQMLDDLRFQTYGKPVTEEFVRYVQSKLSARPAAGSTGAAGARLTVVPPKPPTPVRTGVVAAGPDPDADDDSLDAHARKYGVGGRRR